MCDLNVLGMKADTGTKTILDALCASGCHVATIALEIKDLETLKLACQRLGLVFCEDQRAYKWFGGWVGDYPLPKGFSVADLGKCDHAIQVPGAAYEVGVVYRDGAWKLLWDFYETGGLQQVLGKDAERLKQAYGVSRAILEAERQGYSVWEQTQEDGAVKLHITV